MEYLLLQGYQINKAAYRQDNRIIGTKGKAYTDSDKSGKICLQSEGTPIEYLKIYIEPLE
jgi:hypothetical protein